MDLRQESFYRDGTMATVSQPEPELSLSPFGQIIGTIFISIAIYYISPLLPIWPEYTKRAIWEALVFLTPSRIIYAVDHISQRLLSRADDTVERVRFERADFGNKVAKSEALRRLLRLDGQQTFIPAVGRARALSSGLTNMFGGGRLDVPAGLGNWDNSCYQNSVIQGLASLSTLKDFIDQNLDMVGQSKEMPTHHALQYISRTLNNEVNNGRSFWTPGPLKSMSSWQQQDAQEYFSKIIDELEKEVRKTSRSQKSKLSLAEPLRDMRPSEKSFEEPVATPSASASEEAFRSRVIQHTPASPLEGLMVQRVGCMRCGYTEGFSLIPFTFLTLPLGRTYECDIRDCLDEYTGFETIEGVECSKCTVLNAQARLKRLIDHNKSDRDTKGDSLDEGKLELIRVVQGRLHDVELALEENDFSDKTLSKKLKLDPKTRVTTTKSRQAIVARAPRSLVLHINRSVFDELTGDQYKNTASVRFPLRLDLGFWCLGHVSDRDGEAVETWEIDPSKPMLPTTEDPLKRTSQLYELRAVITHQGRHENGHYIAYRKRPWRLPESTMEDEEDVELNSQGYEERWFRFSDDSVSMASEGQVLSQGGVFMLFYERLEAKPTAPDDTSVGDVHHSNNLDLVDGATFSDGHQEKPEDARNASQEDNTTISTVEDQAHVRIDDVSTASSVIDDSSNYSESVDGYEDGSDISSVGTPIAVRKDHDVVTGYPSPPPSVY